MVKKMRSGRKKEASALRTLSCSGNEREFVKIMQIFRRRGRDFPRSGVRNHLNPHEIWLIPPRWKPPRFFLYFIRKLILIYFSRKKQVYIRKNQNIYDDNQIFLTMPFSASTSTRSPSLRILVAFFVPMMQGTPSSLETIAA